MQNALYIFLHRRWEKDESYLNSLLSYFVNSPDTLHLLMFPEGTNFEEITKTWSDSFARKNNLPFYDYVLHPRVRGFSYCAEKLRQGKLDAVYDVTVGYSENYCFEELDVIKGKIPEEIHFHIQRFSVDELPYDSQGLDEWCCKQWSEKEERLKTFYSKDKKYFASFSESVTAKNNEDEIALRDLYVNGVVFWVVFSSCVCLLIVTSSVLRWYLLFSGTVFFVLTLFGGTDKIFLDTQAEATENYM